MLTSCMTLSDSKIAATADESVEVTCTGRPEIYNEPYIGITCTFHNKSQFPQRIKTSRVDISGDNKSYPILEPLDIQQLALVYQQRNLNNNNSFFLATLIVGSQMHPMASNLPVRTSETISDPPLCRYSDNHLLAFERSLPAKSSTTGDLIVAIPNRETIPEYITICLELPAAECLQISPEISHDLFRLRLFESAH